MSRPSALTIRPPRRLPRLRRAALALCCALPLSIAAQSPTPPPTPAPDPLTMRLRLDDAHRFAALFRRTDGKPSAIQLQQGYLDGASRGVAIFTPHRIVDASVLARAIAAAPERWRYAIDTCLPLLPSLEAEMRAVYLAYQGLAPQLRLPEVYVVFGAGNSGGTAQPDAQVIGLEVMCGPGTTPQDFRQAMRRIFAHETVHAWQPPPKPEALPDMLLLAALLEGVPDYLASLVTGLEPSPEREAWGRAQEAEVWRRFQADREIVRRTRRPDGSFPDEGQAALSRWFGNARSAPPGMPSEAGYWVGMQIARAYVARAADPRRAIEALIRLESPARILADSGYAPGESR